jgi:hypothetical protein
VGANASEFATQKKLQDYAERIGDHLWEGTPAFAKRQQLLSPDQYEIVDVRTSRGMRRAMLFPKAILQAEFYSEQYLRAREAEAMCDHVWIFEARTLSTQPVRRRCGMCGVYRMEPGALRGARMAGVSSSRYAVHRSLWIPDLRTGDDSPLRTSFQQETQKTCHSQ